MFASSAFVLAALTMTGIYMKSRNAESLDNGYTIDFTALEDSVDNKYQEIAQNTEPKQENKLETLEDDLDYMPMEVGSGLVEIPGLTDGTDGIQGMESITEEIVLPQTEGLLSGAETPVQEKPEVIPEETPAETPEEAPEAAEKEAVTSQDVAVGRELHFSEADGLLKPVIGEILIPYSMDGGTYFATLDHYKYNPAVVIGAKEGDAVSACAEGEVIRIFENEEIGHAVTMDLGDGYELTYGQLSEISVTLNSYVNPGDQIASVAAPTKYYSREGGNLYLQLTRNGVPVNPESLF